MSEGDRRGGKGDGCRATLSGLNERKEIRIMAAPLLNVPLASVQDIADMGGTGTLKGAQCEAEDRVPPGAGIAPKR